MPEEFQQYILMPERGVRSSRAPLVTPALRTLLHFSHARSTSAPIPFGLSPIGHINGRAIDSIHEDGPKLVEMTEMEAREFRRQELGLRLEPLRYYRYAQSPSPPTPKPGAPSAGTPIDLKVCCASSGVAIPNVEVLAYTNYASAIGAIAVTDSLGVALLNLGVSPVALDRLYVRPPKCGYWGLFKSSMTITHGQSVALTPISFPYTDGLRHFYPSSSISDGQGVKVAVIDAGVDGSHPDLNVRGGCNTVRGEPRNANGDNGSGHGTHVAGIIASRGGAHNSAPGVLGIAPGANLYSYRVFGSSGAPSTNYSIIKALIYAVDEECDIVNLSLSGDPGNDEALRRALEDARDNGVLVVMAAGNEYRQNVQNPTLYAFNEGLVVSALGRTGTFPTDSYEGSHVNAAPAGTDPNDFAADFTNVGDISLIAPGVGTLSTAEGGGYAPRSGTSMACPAIAGLAASLLANHHHILHAPRDRQRVTDLINVINRRARSLGFPFNVEGFGIP